MAGGFGASEPPPELGAAELGSAGAARLSVSAGPGSEPGPLAAGGGWTAGVAPGAGVAGGAAAGASRLPPPPAGRGRWRGGTRSPPTWNLTAFVASLPSASALATSKENVPAADVSMAPPDATGPWHVMTGERSSGSVHVKIARSDSPTS